jgi:2-phospho-L-lactate guanylyltransferase
MTTVVVPFAGLHGKTRLRLSPWARQALSLAMLGDVLDTCVAVGRTRVVTPDLEAADLAREAGAEAVADPGGGQGAAVQASLCGVEAGTILVVNGDLPCVVASDLRSLLAVTPAGGLALVEARDGTTNALSLPGPEAFAPVYGPRSAGRFREYAIGLGLDVVSAPIPNLVDDVDTLDDLRRLQSRCGPRTRSCLAELTAGVER